MDGTGRDFLLCYSNDAIAKENTSKSLGGFGVQSSLLLLGELKLGSMSCRIKFLDLVNEAGFPSEEWKPFKHFVIAQSYA